MAPNVKKLSPPFLSQMKDIDLKIGKQFGNGPVNVMKGKIVEFCETKMAAER